MLEQGFSGTVTVLKRSETERNSAWSITLVWLQVWRHFRVTSQKRNVLPQKPPLRIPVQASAYLRRKTENAREFYRFFLLLRNRRSMSSKINLPSSSGRVLSYSGLGWKLLVLSIFRIQLFLQKKQMLEQGFSGTVTVLKRSVYEQNSAWASL